MIPAATPLTDLSPTGLLPIEADLLVFELAEVTEDPMPQQPKAFVYEPIDAPRWVAWAVVALGMAMLAILLGGCSSTQAQGVELVHEARILLEKPYPGGKRWEARRSTFMDDSARWLHEVAPATSEAR